jgi:uncharacterized protein with HEPN domain
MWRDDALLLDMLIAAGDARDFVSGIDWQGFAASRLHQSAVVRAIEIIGEAANKLSAEFRDAHPETPWSEIIGMRHRLVHAYNEIRLEIVWDVVQNRLPALVEVIRPLVPLEDQCRDGPPATAERQHSVAPPNGGSPGSVQAPAHELHLPIHQAAPTPSEKRRWCIETGRFHSDFDQFIGIDYSGAQTATSRLKGLQVYASHPGEKAVKWMSPARSNNGTPFNWTRREIAERLCAEARGGTRFLAGIDHGFSFPVRYFERYGLRSWTDFLADFVTYWPTHEDRVYVDCVRDGVLAKRGGPSPDMRVGSPQWLRICELWTSSAKSVFQFDVKGSVAKSSHAGIPWLKWLRDRAGDRLHFWPFDGWDPAPGKSIIVEVYPSIFRNRYERDGHTADEHDAYATACWMADMATRGVLSQYFSPPLSEAERMIATLEGWILGVR